MEHFFFCSNLLREAQRFKMDVRFEISLPLIHCFVVNHVYHLATWLFTDNSKSSLDCSNRLDSGMLVLTNKHLHSPVQTRATKHTRGLLSPRFARTFFLKEFQPNYLRGLESIWHLFSDRPNVSAREHGKFSKWHPQQFNPSTIPSKVNIRI